MGMTSEGELEAGGACDACDACGDELVVRVAVFARCRGCGAENYRPLAGGPPAEARVARFWARWTGPSARVVCAASAEVCA